MRHGGACAFFEWENLGESWDVEWGDNFSLITSRGMNQFPRLFWRCIEEERHVQVMFS